MAVLETFVIALWAILPAYLPNSAAVVTGGGRPIDGGRCWRGHRLLGDGKTWRGTIGGTLAGFLLAGIFTVAAEPLSGVTGVEFPAFTPLAAIGLAGGAMLGDIIASFVKRRTGRKRGAMFPVVDQLDFLLVSLPLTALLATDWFLAVFTWEVILVIAIFTPIAHVGTNVIGFRVGLKEEPW